MKLIHSYVPVDGSPHLYKEAIYVQLLSALLGKREYGSIDFYTNENIKKQVVEIGFPYDNIDTNILSGKIVGDFTIPKLMVFEKVNEPFIHIDADTFIYKKIDFSNVNTVLYSHRDIPVPSQIDLSKKVSEICELYPCLNKCDYFFDASRVTYLDLFDSLLSEHSDFKIKNIRVNEIPNTNIVAVKDYESFNLSAKLTLEHYYKNIETIRNNSHGAVYTDQLMLHLNLMEISQDYYNDVKSGKVFLMNYLPTKIDGNYSWPFSELNYPLNIIHHSPNDNEIPSEIKIDGLLYKKTTQEGYEGRVTQIKSTEDIINYFNFNFYGVAHLTYYKWNKLFQALIIGQIVNMFGVEYIESIFNYYYKNFNLGTSHGEKLYEKITGYKFKKHKGMI